MTTAKRFTKWLPRSYDVGRPWASWIEERPEFAKYLDYRVHKVPGREGLDTSSMDADDIISILQEDPSILSSTIIHMYNSIVIGTEVERAYFQHLDDGEALAYATNMRRGIFKISPNYGCNSNIVNGFMGGFPDKVSITLEEAEMMNNSILSKDRFFPESYIRVLCASKTGLEPESAVNEDHQRIAYSIILNSVNAIRNNEPYSKWEDMDTLIATVCKYDHSSILANVMREGMTISKDYLDNVLLAARPTPTDIDEDTWHGMAEKLIAGADDIGGSYVMTNKGARLINVKEALDRSLSPFLTGDQEELSFLETIHDFMDGDQQLDTEYCSGVLKPEVFDNLREYGPVFTRPLFDMALDHMV